MKKSLLPLLLSLFAITGFSQIVVDRSDFPHIGDLVVTANDETTVLSPGNPGLNQTWDFSNLVATSYDSALFIPVDQAPNYLNYPLADLASQTLNVESGYSYGFYDDPGDDIGIAGIDLQAVIIPGFYMNIHMEYLQPAYFNLPFHYGDSHTSTYTQEGFSALYNNGVQMDTTRVISHVTTQMSVDASGTMITPTGSFPVLRVQETQNFIDSTYVLNGNTWVFESAEPGSNMSYSWYGKNYGLIGKMYISGDRANGMSFFVSETVVDVDSPEVVKNIIIYPNPATTEMTVNSPVEIQKIEIYDMTGSLKMVTNNLKLVNVSKLDSGAYIIKIITSEGVTSSKFIKQ